MAYNEGLHDDNIVACEANSAPFVPTSAFKLSGEDTRWLPPEEVEAARLTVGLNLFDKKIQTARVLYEDGEPQKILFGSLDTIKQQFEDHKLASSAEASRSGTEVPTFSLGRLSDRIRQSFQSKE
jgi:hypothetical protein